MNYLNFIDISNQYPNRKTKTFQIEGAISKAFIGWIQWHGAWRKYCLFTRNLAIWDIKCLQEVQNKIQELMDERK